jgi:hypothetical protein
MQLAFVQKALQCWNFVLTLGRVQAFGSPSTARVLARPWRREGAGVTMEVRALLGAVLTFGRAELLNTSCA